MIPLESSEWKALGHAYGSAEDIPDLLRQLISFPLEENYQTEPFFTLWSSLCHQGDSYSASYAAVPHIVSYAASSPSKASLSYFALPAAIEVSRTRGLGPDIPDSTIRSYHDSLKLLGALAKEELQRPHDKVRSQYLRAAVAIADGDADLADDILNEEGA